MNSSNHCSQSNITRTLNIVPDKLQNRSFSDIHQLISTSMNNKIMPSKDIREIINWSGYVGSNKMGLRILGLYSNLFGLIPVKHSNIPTQIITSVPTQYPPTEI